MLENGSIYLVSELVFPNIEFFDEEIQNMQNIAKFLASNPQYQRESKHVDMLKADWNMEKCQVVDTPSRKGEASVVDK